MSAIFDPILKVVEEQGCYTPASPLPPNFFVEFPDTIGTLNWEYSLDAGAFWRFEPPVSQNEPVSAVFGQVRYRNTFSIPVGYTGTYAVTISGDIYDNATNDPGHIFYDGVDQGPIAPIGGPYTLVFPATPGFHVYEFRHGTTDPDPSGLIVPVVTVDYTLTVPPSVSFPIMIVQAVTPDGSQKIVRYYDAQGNLFLPQPGDVVTIGPCEDCCPINAGTGCTSVGSGTYVSIRNPDGTFSLIDPVTGLPVTALDIIPCPAQPVTFTPASNAIDSSLNRQTGAGAIVIPAGARSITVVVVLGNPTVTIDADPAIILVPGLTLTWGVDDRDETLLNSHTFTGVVGSDFYVTTTRL